MKRKRGQAGEMFYSPTLLSRKGPLGVLWIAAHCCRKLRKAQVSETDVSSSIDKIMLAEIPIAFRVLGHLLIGVVRIYAKKVEYLYHDCNEALIRIRELFASGKISLSKVVSNASFFSVTLPKKFELDAFDLEDMEGVQGGDIRPNKQINLEDEANQLFSAEKFHSMETGFHPVFHSPSHTLVEDVLSPCTMDFDLEISDLHGTMGPGDNIEKLQGNQQPPQDGLDLEIYHGEVESFIPNQHTGDMALWEEQSMSETLSDFGKSPVLAEVFSRDRSPAKSPDNSSAPKISVSITADMMIIPTPTKEERCRSSKKRKHFLDDATVLSNEVMRQGIHDASGLVHVRMKAPYSYLDAWKAEKISNLCQNFMDPLIPYISSELKALFTKEYLNPSKLIESEGVIQLDEIAFETHCTTSDHKAVFCVNSVDSLESVRCMGSPTNNMSNTLRFETAIESSNEEQSVIESPGFWLNLMDEEILSHEEDHQKHEKLSNRTRALALYLQSSSLNQVEILSLTCHLEGRTRKTCARFFYETLVLKSNGYIDVKQDSPYGEILLLPTPQMKAMF